jgi:hypothetical protein
MTLPSLNIEHLLQPSLTPADDAGAATRQAPADRAEEEGLVLVALGIGVAFVACTVWVIATR